MIPEGREVTQGMQEILWVFLVTDDTEVSPHLWSTVTTEVKGSAGSDSYAAVIYCGKFKYVSHIENGMPSQSKAFIIYCTNMVWISGNHHQRLWSKHNAGKCKSCDHMRWIKLPQAVSMEETKSIQVIWVEEQIWCKGLGKQSQIFTASKRTFPLTLFCMSPPFVHRHS